MPFPSPTVRVNRLRSTVGCSFTLLVLAAPSPASAQRPGSAVSCADSLRRVLGSLEGVWEVQAQFRQGPTGWDSAAAVVTIAPALGGCVLQEHFVGTRWGAPYEYLAVWGTYGDAEAPIQRTFVHSQHGILSLSAGRFHGDTLVLQDRHTIGGTSVLEEQRFVGIAPPAFDVLNRRTTDEGMTWTVTVRTHFRYLRRPPF